jgi:hypothetical protein
VLEYPDTAVFTFAQYNFEIVCSTKCSSNRVYIIFIIPVRYVYNCIL